jgi:hypothetical protein
MEICFFSHFAKIGKTTVRFGIEKKTIFTALLKKPSRATLTPP